MCVCALVSFTFVLKRQLYEQNGCVQCVSCICLNVLSFDYMIGSTMTALSIYSVLARPYVEHLMLNKHNEISTGENPIRACCFRQHSYQVGDRFKTNSQSSQQHDVDVKVRRTKHRSAVMTFSALHCNCDSKKIDKYRHTISMQIC